MTTHGQDHEGHGRQEPQPRYTHLSAAGLRARGWTPGMVRQLLGEPDMLVGHPIFESAPRTRLYLLERIEAAEQSEEFKAIAAAAARRSGAARAAAARRRREVLARIAAEPMDVPRLTPDRLAALAVEHRNRREEERTFGRWQRGRGRVKEAAGIEGAEPAALDRWKVDYLCHRLTRHHQILGELYGSTGRAAAEELLRRRVYAAISEAYPSLAQECEHRLRDQRHGPSPG